MAPAFSLIGDENRPVIASVPASTVMFPLAELIPLNTSVPVPALIISPSPASTPSPAIVQVFVPVTSKIVRNPGLPIR